MIAINLTNFVSNFSTNNELNKLAHTIEALGQKALGLPSDPPASGKLSASRKQPQKQPNPSKKEKESGKTNASSSAVEQEIAAALTDESPIYADEIGGGKLQLSVNRDSVLQGILFSEILGKPKCKRTGR